MNMMKTKVGPWCTSRGLCSSWPTPNGLTTWPVSEDIVAKVSVASKSCGYSYWVISMASFTQTYTYPPPTPVLAIRSGLSILCLVAKLCGIHCDIVNMYPDSLLWAHQHGKLHEASVHDAPASRLNSCWTSRGKSYLWLCFDSNQPFQGQ